MNMKWIRQNQEGLMVGAIWGYVSCYIAMGFAVTKFQLDFLDYLLIAPTYLAGMILPLEVSYVTAKVVTILIGALIGGLIDSYYKPGK